MGERTHDDVARCVTMKALDGAAFGHVAVFHHPGLLRARFVRGLFRQNLSQQRHRLDVAAPPALIRDGDRPRCPFPAAGAWAMDLGWVNIMIVGSTFFGNLKSRSATPRVI